MGCNEEAIGAVGLKASSAAESKASGVADMVGDGTAVGLSRQTGWIAVQVWAKGSQLQDWKQ